MEALFDNLPLYIMQFYDSRFVAVWKFLAAVYVAVLAVDLVLLLILINARAEWRKVVRGMDIPTPKRPYLRRWRAIEKRMKSDNASHYKVAVLEADKLVDSVRNQIGYSGKNLHERLAQMNTAQFVHVDAVREAHETRNRIVREEDFQLSRNDAKKTLAVYEAFLQDLELL